MYGVHIEHLHFFMLVISLYWLIITRVVFGYFWWWKRKRLKHILGTSLLCLKDNLIDLSRQLETTMTLNLCVWHLILWKGNFSRDLMCGYSWTERLRWTKTSAHPEYCSSLTVSSEPTHRFLGGVYTQWKCIDRACLYQSTVCRYFYKITGT